MALLLLLNKFIRKNAETERMEKKNKDRWTDMYTALKVIVKQWRKIQKWMKLQLSEIY